MQTTYRVKADELTEDFLEALKTTYRDQERQRFREPRRGSP